MVKKPLLSTGRGENGNASPASAFTLSVEANLFRNGGMKKTYEKPRLVKREKLTARTAQIVASGVVLGE